MRYDFSDKNGLQRLERLREREEYFDEQKVVEEEEEKVQDGDKDGFPDREKITLKN